MTEDSVQKNEDSVLFDTFRYSKQRLEAGPQDQKWGKSSAEVLSTATV